MEDLLRQIDSKLGDLLSIYKLLNSDRIEQAKEQFLGDGTRKAVYDACDGQTSGKDIAEKLGVTPAAVSQHLASLAQAGLVCKESFEGKKYYVKKLEG